MRVSAVSSGRRYMSSLLSDPGENQSSACHQYRVGSVKFGAVRFTIECYLLFVVYFVSGPFLERKPRDEIVATTNNI